MIVVNIFLFSIVQKLTYLDYLGALNTYIITVTCTELNVI